MLSANHLFLCPSSQRSFASVLPSVRLPLCLCVCVCSFAHTSPHLFVCVFIRRFILCVCRCFVAASVFLSVFTIWMRYTLQERAIAGGGQRVQLMSDMARPLIPCLLATPES